MSSLRWFVLCLPLTGLWPAPAVLPAQDVIRIEAEEAQLQIRRQVPISTEVTGTLVLVEPSREGVEVKQGDLLIRVNDSVIRKEVLHARTQAEQMTEIEFAQKTVEIAELELHRKTEANLRSANTYNPNEMLDAQLEVHKARAQLAKAQDDQVLHRLNAEVKEATLAQYEVKAPFDGVITKVHRFPAQNVRPGDPVVTITDMSELRAVVKVPLQYRDLLFVGDDVEIRPRISGRPNSAPTAQKPSPQNESVGDAGDFFNNSGPNAEPATVPFLPAGSLAQDRASILREQTFSGRIDAIEPEVVPLTGGDGAFAIALDVSVPNRKDRFGRWLLQQGLEVDAVILARPRSE